MTLCVQICLKVTIGTEVTLLFGKGQRLKNIFKHINMKMYRAVDKCRLLSGHVHKYVFTFLSPSYSY